MQKVITQISFLRSKGFFSQSVAEILFASVRMAGAAFKANVVSIISAHAGYGPIANEKVAAETKEGLVDKLKSLREQMALYLDEQLVATRTISSKETKTLVEMFNEELAQLEKHAAKE